jgi:hypothetical protein
LDKKAAVSNVAALKESTIFSKECQDSLSLFPLVIERRGQHYCSPDHQNADNYQPDQEAHDYLYVTEILPFWSTAESEFSPCRNACGQDYVSKGFHSVSD